jgi:2-keto-4-pentenoate hydratase/2-oxohepta-3-ene-1,7-dioic acid hydratase in catechol pathway
MTWSLASYTARGGRGFGVLREDGALVGPAGLERWPTSMDLLEDWPEAEAVLRGLDVDNAPVIEYDALLPPLRWPRKVICAGVNYRKHMREMGGEIPAAGWRPFFFLKAPTTSVIGPRDPIVISAAARARYDWEAELAVVIGVKGKNIDPERAGFTPRLQRLQRHHGARLHGATTPADAFRYDWFAANR